MFDSVETPARASLINKRRGIKVLIIIISALVIIPLTAELALRTHRLLQNRVAQEYLKAHPTAYDQNRDVMEAAGDSLWLEPMARYQPGAHLTLTVNGQLHTISINRHGYRDREFTVPKPAGILRVVCIGGSTTVQGASNEETYPALLERLLRERFGPQVEVWNLGVSGVCSDYWPDRPGQLAELLRFEPDIVVQYEGVNDIFWRQLVKYDTRHPIKALLRTSALFARCFPLNLKRMDQPFNGTFENMQRLHVALETNGVLHVIGTFPRPDIAKADKAQRAFLEFNMTSWTGYSSPRTFSEYCALLDCFNRRLVARAHNQGWRLAPIHERITAPTRFVDICHMTPEGIADLAAAFYPEVAAAVEAVVRTRDHSTGDKK